MPATGNREHGACTAPHAKSQESAGNRLRGDCLGVVWRLGSTGQPRPNPCGNLAIGVRPRYRQRPSSPATGTKESVARKALPLSYYVWRVGLCVSVVVPQGLAMHASLGADAVSHPAEAYRHRAPLEIKTTKRSLLLQAARASLLAGAKGGEQR
ncbi:hypothetical protein NDU88_011514 [Pleurodeles waltl]|uniref:Uncharacterized protein n=1 Tax=Pleurodeles waltl TaxID=8319 RepID=A0AAV7QYT7_PLEWA|nr:hypothetical protein NDU88_011514 [Pleurodeles waltl]